jgi:hypothetical protein
MAAARPLIEDDPVAAPRARRWWVFPLILGVSLGVLSLLPYALAYLLTPAGVHFQGFFFIADDAATYLSKMREGAEGAWLWTDPYTSGAHQGVFLFGFYLLLGHLAALMHLPLIAAYHLARVSGAVALALGLGALAERTLAPEHRRLAIALGMLGSGLGFVVQSAHNPVVAGIPLQALDLHLPELSGWYSILAIPHFAWAAALICWTLCGLLSVRRQASWGGLALTAAALNALTIIHPQMVPVLALVWAGTRLSLLAVGERIRPLSVAAEAAAFLTTAPLFAYSAWILYRDPVISQWASQWRHQAPDLLSLLIGLGIPLITAIIGMVVLWRRRIHDAMVLMVWIPLVIALLYLPNVTSIQRRLLDALYVPVGFLAAVGIHRLVQALPRRWRRSATATLVAGSCLTSGLVLAIALRFATGAFAESYVSTDEWQALTWLSGHHQANDRVLSSPGVGLLIPAWSGTAVYVGHYSETVSYFQKIAAADALLQPATSAQQFQLFAGENGVTLLYWGPDERQGRNLDPQATWPLELVYHSGTVSIYRLEASH